MDTDAHGLAKLNLEYLEHLLRSSEITIISVRRARNAKFQVEDLISDKKITWNQIGISKTTLDTKYAQVLALAILQGLVQLSTHQPNGLSNLDSEQLALAMLDWQQESGLTWEQIGVYESKVRQLLKSIRIQEYTAILGKAFAVSTFEYLEDVEEEIQNFLRRSGLSLRELDTSEATLEMALKGARTRVAGYEADRLSRYSKTLTQVQEMIHKILTLSDDGKIDLGAAGITRLSLSDILRRVKEREQSKVPSPSDT